MVSSCPFCVEASGQSPAAEQVGLGRADDRLVSLQSPYSLPAQKPKVSENDFEDLLPNQGFSKPDKKGPKTMAEMRKQDLARDTDPLKLKVGGLGPGQGLRALPRERAPRHVEPLPRAGTAGTGQICAPGPETHTEI